MPRCTSTGARSIFRVTAALIQNDSASKVAEAFDKNDTNPFGFKFQTPEQNSLRKTRIA